MFSGIGAAAAGGDDAGGVVVVCAKAKGAERTSAASATDKRFMDISSVDCEAYCLCAQLNVSAAAQFLFDLGAACTDLAIHLALGCMFELRAGTAKLFANCHWRSR